MAQQNKKQPIAKTGLARCLELASGHKGLVFLAGFLAALAAICSFVPYLSIYYIIREILFVYPDMSLLNVSAISTWDGWPWLEFWGTSYFTFLPCCVPTLRRLERFMN